MVVLNTQTYLMFIVLLTTSMGQLVEDRVNQGLVAVPNDIDPYVTILKLNRNNIRNISDGDMAGLRWLEKLYIDFNKIRFISAHAFANNMYLALFSFVEHRLTIFPAELGGVWGSIEVVVCSVGPNDMQSVQLTHLPALKKVGNQQQQHDKLNHWQRSIAGGALCSVVWVSDVSRLIKRY